MSDISKYINKEELLYTTTNNIGENANIVIDQIEKNGNRFFDVKLIMDKTEKFLGRYARLFSIFDVKYKDGKILICNMKFDGCSEKVQIEEVLALYEIVDDLFYSCTNEEALELFDKDIDRSYLLDKDKLTIRSDMEKRKRYRV